MAKSAADRQTGKQAPTRRTVLAGLSAASVLGACAQPEVVLPGDRLDLRGVALTPDAAGAAQPISLPSQVVNTQWTHRNGSAAHKIAHPQLGGALTQAFTVDIGPGNNRRQRITADPVVAGGRVFTMDAQNGVAATSVAGAALWERSLIPPLENARDASGGGLAATDELVLATTGFGELVALDAATGDEVWRQDLDAPGTSAPTVLGGLVYVVARDGRAWAIELNSGRIAWTQSGTPPVSNFGGGAGAAVTSDIAIFPFPSGEVMAVFPQGGLRRWSTVVTGQRPGQAASTVSDIAGDPVIDGDRVYVGNISGRVVALQTATGDRLWTANEGTVGPVWPVGGSVFLINDLSELVRLDASDGRVVWRMALPGFEETRARRQKTRFAHYGPIVAGGRVIVASGDGALRQFDASSGALLGQLELRGGAASNPVVAQGVLYVVSQRGELVAFR